MKWKTLLTIVVMMSFFGFIVVCSLLVAASMEGVQKQLVELTSSPIMNTVLLLSGIAFFLTALACFNLLKKVEILDEIDIQADALEKEKDKFKSATAAFVKMHKIETKDLL